MSGDNTNKALTPRQRRFVDLYMGECEGNGVQSARKAGYQGDDLALRVTASRLLSRANIRAEIDKIADKSPHIATREERLRFLSAVMGDSTVAMRDRLKAVDLLSKVTGDYVQRVEVSGPDGSPVQTETRIDLKGLSLEDLKVLKG